MRRSVLLLSFAALAVAPCAVIAQAAPSLAGTWTLIAEPNVASVPGRGGRGGLGRMATIAQDAKMLTVTRIMQNGEMKMLYNLDGSESRNTVTMGGNPIEQSSTTKWSDNKYVITTMSSFNGKSFTSTMTLWLDASGNLVVESTSPARGGGAPVTTTMSYKKS